jgi:hypothetical protein
MVEVETEVSLYASDDFVDELTDEALDREDGRLCVGCVSRCGDPHRP